jgi:hypothetical protein
VYWLVRCLLCSLIVSAPVEFVELLSVCAIEWMVSVMIQDLCYAVDSSPVLQSPGLGLFYPRFLRFDLRLGVSMVPVTVRDS